VSYSVYLADQLKRAGLEQHVTFLEETPDIDLVYQQADALLLTSRLDPLPNVAIDALCEGLPVLCFDKTTGIADILREEMLGEVCVAEYLDTHDLSEKVLQLIEDEKLHRKVVDITRKMAAKRFDFNAYVERLEQLARLAAEQNRQMAKDAALIGETHPLRHDFVRRPHEIGQSTQEVERAYVQAWACGMMLRKPFPGFHPGVYREQRGLQLQDPLADFLRAGRPKGPWLSKVITEADTPAPRGNAKVALHIHVFYADLLEEMLARLGRNSIAPDLFVSVPDISTQVDVERLLRGYRGQRTDVRVVPNRGRDIGPFLTEFSVPLAGYDFVGHLHTKKSADAKDPSMGQNWYSFLLENLLGGNSGAMADRILGHMQSDPSIGMVFPDDPNVVGWEANLPYAKELAQRLGIDRLPEYLQFPVGTMFWARREAIEPFWRLDLKWQDYPEEPLPYDGSLLHAIERLFALSTTSSSMQCAVTNVFGMTR
jgi:hypothetical protein